MSEQSNIIEGTVRAKLGRIIFKSDTPTGKWFDVFLLLAIVVSVIVVMLETVPSLEDRYKELFKFIEFFFTALFTAEYILRLYTASHPKKYVLSFYGLIDLVSILPSYLSFIIPGAQALLIIRVIRVLRVFKIFRMSSFLHEGDQLGKALKDSRYKILVFMSAVLVLVTVFGSIIYLIEHETNDGFDSIPRGIWFAIVTLTTVGYGDISPQTPIGQFIASIIMILGYAVIAIPTGIVTNELSKGSKSNPKVSKFCSSCGTAISDVTAKYCHNCGSKLLS